MQRGARLAVVPQVERSRPSGVGRMSDVCFAVEADHRSSRAASRVQQAESTCLPGILLVCIVCIVCMEVAVRLAEALVAVVAITEVRK